MTFEIVVIIISVILSSGKDGNPGDAVFNDFHSYS
jgi:hypothetical protein